MGRIDARLQWPQDLDKREAAPVTCSGQLVKVWRLSFTYPQLTGLRYTLVWQRGIIIHWKVRNQVTYLICEIVSKSFGLVDRRRITMSGFNSKLW